MAGGTQALEVSPSLRAVFHCVGMARGSPGTRQLGSWKEEILIQAIREHAVRAQVLAVVNDSLRQNRRKE